ncbi:CHAT domain-containing protein, partial [Plectonema radiosum NIES-515]
QEALQVSELLQLSELQNFFGDECVQVARQPSKNSASVANNTNNHAAVINSIILNERTYILLRLPNGKLNSYPVAMSEKELEKEIDHLRLTLEDISTDEYLTESQKVYDLTIRPMAEDLAQAKPNTLVFINDGVLRNVPMAALHDGKQFLVEKYAIATTLGFDLNSHKQHIKRDTKAVIFGLTAEIPPFAPLPNVKSETEGVQKILGGKRFLDKDFTLENLQKQIDNFGYSIIHLATHGKFGADPNSTFLQLFDRRVSLNEFESILLHSKKPIELLTLSACQTAVGDSRATLGIAGVALRAGVQSTLATLWFVNDADTVPLIQDFYTQMQQPNLTKAEALRQAQLKIIADPNGHPAIWSPFVLVGNWQ